jgi:hypothetical protein
LEKHCKIAGGKRQNQAHIEEQETEGSSTISEAFASRTVRWSRTCCTISMEILLIYILKYWKEHLSMKSL